jgi:hypothetical protein
MGAISWPSIGCYSLFSIFVYYQQLHGRDFKEGSQVFALVLNFFGFAGMLTGLAYLGYYGWTVTWWVPLVVFVIGTVGVIPGVLVERVVGRLTMSLAGFVAWPLSAYFMFHYIPN